MSATIYSAEFRAVCKSALGPEYLKIVEFVDTYASDYRERCVAYLRSALSQLCDDVQIQKAENQGLREELRALLKARPIVAIQPGESADEYRARRARGVS